MTPGVTPSSLSGYDMPAEARCLEAVITCVGFDDILDVTLPLNHPQVDHLIVVTSHEDKKVQQVAKKHSCTVVPTDLFYKNDRNFNKGCAINAGMDYFQFGGWRAQLDVDVVLPPNFRRLFFNHTHLDQRAIYGMSRVNVVGKAEWEKLAARLLRNPDHHRGYGITHWHGRESGTQYLDGIRGWVPLGFAQLWHASQDRHYPFSKGTAAHDDIMFGALWPREHRHLLPFTCYHLVPANAKGNNWDGIRKSPKFT